MRKLNKIGQLFLAVFFTVQFMAAGAAVVIPCDTSCDGRCHGENGKIAGIHHGIEKSPLDCCSQKSQKKTLHPCCDVQSPLPMAKKIPAMLCGASLTNNLLAPAAAVSETGIEDTHLDTSPKNWVYKTPLNTRPIYIQIHSLLC